VVPEILANEMKPFNDRGKIIQECLEAPPDVAFSDRKIIKINQIHSWKKNRGNLKEQ
jgi:hypothetical protein